MYRMLIIDDEERIVNSIYDLMEERFDFELYRYTNPLQALTTARRMRIDIIISDVSMPRMNGLELMAEVRKIWPKCHFLMLTAYNIFEYAYQALKYDRVDYLLKLESYDTLCGVVEKKRVQIEQERRLEERLLDYDRSIQQLNNSMRRYFLKRIIVMGTPLPDQSDLDEIVLPLSLSEPVFLVLATTKAYGAANHGHVAAIVDDWVNAQLEQYELKCFSYTSASSQNIIFAIQACVGTEFTQEDLTVYIHTVFDKLANLVEEQIGIHMAVLCSDRFVQWEQIHALYQRCAIHLGKMHGDSFMEIIMVDKELNQQCTDICYPNIDEISFLWEMIKNGKFYDFREAVEHGLGGLFSSQSIHTLRTHTSVTAICYLLSEITKLYAPEFMQTEVFDKLVHRVEEYESPQQWLEEVFATVENILSINETYKENRGAWLVEKVDEYIEKHYAEDITLTTLAEQMHYSPSYLSRYYKSNSGVNVMNRLYDVRILKAQELLATTNLRIKEIAEQTGFCSAKYFSRVFNKKTGLMPIQYRNIHGRNPGC